MNKIEKDSQIQSRLTSEWQVVGGRGMEQKRKKTHGHRQQCGDCSGWGQWWVEVEEGIRGINCNGKNTIKYSWKNKNKNKTKKIP